MSVISILIDESGDLGTNLTNNISVKYFIIGALVCFNNEAYRHILKAAERTIKNKLNGKNQTKNKFLELKGSKASLSIKEYFFKHSEKNSDWELYFYVLDKTKFIKYLSSSNDKIRIYNFLAKNLIEKIKLDNHIAKINLYIDKHKSSLEEKKFNQYIETHLSIRLPLNTKLNYYHLDSKDNKGIQAIDLYCSGVNKKYNKSQEDWYKIFKKKISFEEELFPEDKRPFNA